MLDALKFILTSVMLHMIDEDVMTNPMGEEREPAMKQSLTEFYDGRLSRRHKASPI